MPKISELPLANKLKEEDYIPIVQDGVTKKVKGTHFVTEEEYSLDAFSPTIAANDKAMYKFGEGDTVDFSDSAYDGAYKSAILRGCTGWTNEDGDIFETFFTPITELTFTNHYLNVDGTLVTNGGHFCTDFLDITGFDGITMGRDSVCYGKMCFYDSNKNFVKWVSKEGTTGVIPTQEIPSNAKYVRYSATTNYGIFINDKHGRNMMLPLSLINVKMPVLRTTGKNMFDKENFYNDWKGKQPNYIYNEIVDGEEVLKIHNLNLLNGDNKGFKIFVEKDVPLTLTIKCKKAGTNETNSVFLIRHSDSSSVNIGRCTSNEWVERRATFTPTRDYITICSAYNVNDYFYIKDIQLEAGSVTTPYEPYKTNILSTPSDLELRGIGDVMDTLNLLTGEVVNKFNVIKPSINDSWKQFTLTQPTQADYTGFYIPIFNAVPSKTNNATCDKFNWSGASTISQTNGCSRAFSIHENGNLYFRIEKSIANTVDEWESWLQENPIIVQYQLAEKVHKTVDLSGTPFGYKGGHIIKSSAEGSLLPKFEYEVAVSRGAQISQNTSTLIKHDEKITELLKKTAATYINQKAEIAYLLNMSSTLEEVQTIPFIEDDYVNDDCMVDSDMVMDDMEVEPEKEIIDNVDTLLINLIYDLIELNDTLGLSEKVELFRQSGLIDKHNYEIIKEKLNPTFKEEDYAGINQ